jgi:P pilus assembly chaperone PapD
MFVTIIRLGVGVTALACSLVAVATAASAPQPPAAISVTPTQLVLDGRSAGTITVTNPGLRRMAVTTEVGNYVIASDGGVVVDPQLPPARSAKRWISVSPRTLRLAPGASVQVAVESRPARHARPGDHHALVMFTTVSVTNQVAIRTRVGIPILVRVAGTLVRDLRVMSLRVDRTGDRHSLRLAVANRGNVNERLLRGQVTVLLRRGARTLAVLQPGTRTLLPGTAATLVMPYGGALRGRLTALVRVRPTPGEQAGPGLDRAVRGIERTFAIRL